MRLLAALLAGMLAACGFHLQGADTLPPVMSSVYIDTPDPYSPFYRGMQRSLRTSGAALLKVRGSAGAVLIIHEDNTGQRVLSVSPRNIAEEYEVYYDVRYSLRSGGEVLLEPQTVSLRRDYTYDETKVLAKAEEEKVIRQALASDIVRMVRRRIATLQ